MAKVDVLAERVRSGDRLRRRLAAWRLARLETPESVRALADIADSVDVSVRGHAVVDLARNALARLTDQSLVDVLCDALLATGRQGLAELVERAGHRHSDASADAVVSFLAGDFERHRALDPTGAALREVHERGDEMLRFRLAERARAEASMEWVRGVVGGRRSGQFAAVTEGDWAAVTEILGATNRWRFLWRLVFAAPPAWGARMLHTLEEAKWRPADPVERRAFAELSGPVRASRPALRRGWVPADATRLPHEGGAKSLAVAPDGGRVYVGTRQGVDVLALPTGEGKGTMRRDDATGGWLAVTPDGGLLVTDHTVHRAWPPRPDVAEEVASLWALPTGKPAGVLTGHVDNRNAILITRDGRHLVLGDRTGRIHLWHLPSGKPAATLDGTRQAVACLAASHGGQLLACGHVDGTIMLWQLVDRELLGRLQFGGPVHRVALPHGGTLAAVGGGGLVKVWDLARRGAEPRVVGYVIGEVVATGDVRTDPDSALLVAAVQDGVQTWRLPAGTEHRLVPFQGSGPTKWSVLGDGEFLAGFGPFTNEVQLWQLPDCGAVGILADDSRRPVEHLSASADGSTIVTADSDEVVTLWRLWGRHLRALSRRPLADVEPGAVRHTATSLPGERAWQDLVTALVRWRDHPRIAAYDGRWDAWEA